MDFCVLYVVPFAVVNVFFQSTMLVTGPGHRHISLEAFNEDPATGDPPTSRNLRSLTAIFFPILIYFRNR